MQSAFRTYSTSKGNLVYVSLLLCCIAVNVAEDDITLHLPVEQYDVVLYGARDRRS